MSLEGTKIAAAAAAVVAPNTACKLVNVIRADFVGTRWLVQQDRIGTGFPACPHALVGGGTAPGGSRSDARRR